MLSYYTVIKMEEYRAKKEKVNDKVVPQRSMYDKIVGALGFYVPEPTTDEEKEKDRLRRKAFDTDNPAEAAKLFEKAGAFGLAAYAAKRAGLTGEAKRLYGQNVEELEKKHDYSRAAESAKAGGFIERAVENYEKAGEPLLAARLAENEGLTQKSKELYEKFIDTLEKNGEYDRAEGIAKEAGFTEKAKELRKKTKKDDAVDEPDVHHHSEDEEGDNTPYYENPWFWVYVMT